MRFCQGHFLRALGGTFGWAPCHLPASFLWTRQGFHAAGFLFPTSEYRSRLVKPKWVLIIKSADIAHGDRNSHTSWAGHGADTFPECGWSNTCRVLEEIIVWAVARGPRPFCFSSCEVGEAGHWCQGPRSVWMSTSPSRCGALLSAVSRVGHFRYPRCHSL